MLYMEMIINELAENNRHHILHHLRKGLQYGPVRKSCMHTSPGEQSKSQAKIKINYKHNIIDAGLALFPCRLVLSCS